MRRFSTLFVAGLLALALAVPILGGESCCTSDCCKPADCCITQD